MTGEPETPETIAIRDLNDKLRTTAIGGQIIFSSFLANEGPLKMIQVLTRVVNFDDFNADNDPHNEHDFGSVDHEGETYFFKIDYYNRDMKGHSEHPADPNQTVRVLSIFHASEY